MHAGRGTAAQAVERLPVGGPHAGLKLLRDCTQELLIMMMIMMIMMLLMMLLMMIMMPLMMMRMTTVDDDVCNWSGEERRIEGAASSYSMFLFAIEVH